MRGDGWSTARFAGEMGGRRMFPTTRKNLLKLGKKMILNVKYYEFPYKERGSKSAVTVTLAQQKVE
jgi:hypothetical protein